MTPQHDTASHIEVTQNARVLTATFHSPPHALMGADLAQQLIELVAGVDADPSIGAVILTGAHPTRFIADADLRYLQEGGRDSPAVGPKFISAFTRASVAAMGIPLLGPLIKRSPLARVAQLERLHAAFLQMNTSGVVFIAALNGSAQGVGHEVALACDYRIAADGDFAFGQPEILQGFIPGAGASQRLSRLIGAHQAKRLILTGAALTPTAALQLGTVDEVVAPEQLLERAHAVAATMATRSKAGVAAVKRCIAVGSSLSLKQGLRPERAEMLAQLPLADTQAVMIEYLRVAELTGEPPLYQPRAYHAALADGSFPGRRSQR